MKVRLNKATWRAFGGIIASGVLVVSFQNCGKAGFDSSLDDEISSAAVDAALSAKYGSATGAKVAAIPFAFDATVDTITYNSCAESSLTGQEAFFSLKAGAYSTGGIKLNDAFFTYVDNPDNFKPNYPATTISKEQYANFLADSPANKDAVANLAIRSKTNLLNVYSSSTSVTLGTDVVGLASTLTDSLIMTSLNTAKAAPYISYFPFSPDARVVEATMKFNTDQGIAQGFRNVLANDGALVLSYLNSSSDPNVIRGPSSTSPMKTAYGRAYKLGFGQPANRSAEASRILPANQLQGITETDLSTGSVSGSWNCTRQYLVVRAQDAATYCPAVNYATLTGSYLAELEVVRRQIRADLWDVNPILKCVVPKGGVSCYNEDLVNGAASGVNYYTTSNNPGSTAGTPEAVYGECFNSLLSAGAYMTSTIPTKRCGNYISICTRN
ncbi:hypothetical protein [Bdellovibrio sp. NC01]|uniref:hypothetical protein n=1 Tax=Bdellovibrio sp. NC01 TaxID=2220073 RepID=UPI001FEEC58C|nr:hypothetical protein [Bdellovibrio sp. NC01]